MSVKLFTFNYNPQLSDLTNLTEEHEIKAHSIKISQNANQQTKAEISINYSTDIKVYDLNFCIVTYNEKIIFSGKIDKLQIIDGMIYLNAILNTNKEAIQKAFNEDPINEIFNPSKKNLYDILLFKSDGSVHNINKCNKYQYKTKLTNQNIYKKEHVLANSNEFSEVDVNVKWIEHEQDIRSIPKNLLHEKLLRKLNRKTKYGNYHVMPSNIYQNFIQFKNNRKNIRAESWKIKLYAPNIKDLKININADKYVQQYKEWEENNTYLLNDKVIFQGKIYECVEGHVSKLQWESQYWIRNTEIYSFNGREYNSALLNNEFGQLMLGQLMKLLNCYIEKNSYNEMIIVEGPMKDWAFIEVMDQIEFQDISGNFKIARVFAYEKIFTNDEYIVRFKLYFNSYLQPLPSSDSKYCSEDYFAEEYSLDSLIENSKHFKIQHHYTNENKLCYRLKTEFKLLLDPNEKATGIKIIDSNHNYYTQEILLDLYKNEELKK